MSGLFFATSHLSYSIALLKEILLDKGCSTAQNYFFSGTVYNCKTWDLLYKHFQKKIIILTLAIFCHISNWEIFYGIGYLGQKSDDSLTVEDFSNVAKLVNYEKISHIIHLWPLLYRSSIGSLAVLVPSLSFLRDVYLMFCP